MGTVRLQATVQEYDIPYLERFLKGISATEINFEREEKMLLIFLLLKTSKPLRSQKSKETSVWLQAMTMFLKKSNILEVQNNNLYLENKIYNNKKYKIFYSKSRFCGLSPSLRKGSRLPNVNTLFD